MGSYISSNSNRFYAAIEASYAQAAPVSASNRFPAVRLQVAQALERGKRVDKTGTRTFLGTSASSRRHTAFDTKTYLTSWSGTGEPGYGPLFHAVTGGTPQLSTGLVIAGAPAPTQIQTTAAHGLSAGAAVSYLNEIRFVTSVRDGFTLSINAPFSNVPLANTALATTVTYRLSAALPSMTLYDYWDPITAVSRVITGAAVDLFSLAINGDFHEFSFSGPAADVLDSSSFAPGAAGLATYPAEPAPSSFDYSIVPGHLGQVWIGSVPDQFFTLTDAMIEIKNNIAMRDREFGSSYPRAIAPGEREVASTFTLFAQDDPQTKALYVAAKDRAVVSAMLQLGQQTGQIMGVFMPSVMPEVPGYVDSQTRLQWEFKSNLAQGTAEDEITIAFA
jgi:hypothetical protein